MLSATLLLRVLVLCRVMVLSKLGRVLPPSATPRRATRFCGYNPLSLQALRLDALRGAVRRGRRALRAAGGHHQSRRDVPRQLGGDRNRVALGGRGTLLGPHPRARRCSHGAKSVLTRAFPELWLFVLGLAVHRGDTRVARRRDGVLRLCSAREEGAMNLDTPGRTGPLPRAASRVTFDGFRALDSLSLLVEPGELRCVIGPNGAGKTTLMDVITGRTRPDRATCSTGRRTTSPGCPRRRSSTPASAGSSRSPPSSGPTPCSRTSSWR